MNSALSLDDRMVATSTAARDAIDSGRRFEGLTVFTSDTSQNWQLQGGITNSDWYEVAPIRLWQLISDYLTPLVSNYGLTVNGTTTLATTTMAYDSLIGYGTEGFQVVQKTISGPLSGTFPLIKFNSPNAWDNGIGGIDKGLVIIEDSTIEDGEPGLIFAADDFGSTFNVTKLAYSTSTKTLSLSNLDSFIGGDGKANLIVNGELGVGNTTRWNLRNNEDGDLEERYYDAVNDAHTYQVVNQEGERTWYGQTTSLQYTEQDLGGMGNIPYLIATPETEFPVSDIMGLPDFVWVGNTGSGSQILLGDPDTAFKFDGTDLEISSLNDLHINSAMTQNDGWLGVGTYPSFRFQTYAAADEGVALGVQGYDYTGTDSSQLIYITRGLDVEVSDNFTYTFLSQICNDTNVNFTGNPNDKAININGISSSISKNITVDSYGTGSSDNYNANFVSIENFNTYAGANDFSVNGRASQVAIYDELTLDSADKTLTENVYGNDTFIYIKPTETAGTLNATYYGQYINLYDNGASITNGTFTTYGLYINNVAYNSADVSYGIYDSSSANWRLNSVDQYIEFGDKDVKIGSDDDGYLDLVADTGIRVSNFVRHTSSDYRRYYHLPVSAFNPGASGATWTPLSANTIGGYRLDSAGEKLYFDTDVHDDWDGASDLVVEIYFAVNVNNIDGGTGDTVDLKLDAYYNSVGDTSTKTQTQEVATVVGQSAQYKVFKSTHTLNWDEVDKVIEAGDMIGFILNLETDTSEVDDVIILHGGFYYNTTHLGIESGDI